MKKQRCAFTLLEMLLVMGLFLIAMSVCAFPLLKALREVRYKKNIEQLETKLVLAQELMLDFHTPMTLRLHQTEAGLCTTLEAGQLLPSALQKALPTEVLTGIKRMAVDGRQTETVCLHFDATLGAIPHLTLTFSASPEDAPSSSKKEERLVLNGYPTRRHRVLKQISHVTQVAYPEEILSLN